MYVLSVRVTVFSRVGHLAKLRGSTKLAKVSKGWVFVGSRDFISVVENVPTLLPLVVRYLHKNATKLARIFCCNIKIYNP